MIYLYRSGVVIRERIPTVKHDQIYGINHRIMKQMTYFNLLTFVIKSLREIFA